MFNILALSILLFESLCNINNFADTSPPHLSKFIIGLKEAKSAHCDLA